MFARRKTWSSMRGDTKLPLSHNGRDPQIDYLAFRWYDYGLSNQMDHLGKYNKSVWVTEFANWHSQNDGSQMTTRT